MNISWFFAAFCIIGGLVTLLTLPVVEYEDKSHWKVLSISMSFTIVGILFLFL